jgi:hypothetical protein
VFYIHSFDPGKTSGYATLVVTSKEDGTTEIQYDGAVELIDAKDWHCAISSFVYHKKPSVVVCESFYLYPHKAQDQIGSSFPSAEWVGVLKYCTTLKNVPIVFQPALCMKMIKWSICTDLFPQLVGSAQSKSDHIKDAIKHGLYYYFKVVRTQGKSKKT